MNPIYCKYSKDRDKKFGIKTYIKVDESGNKAIYKYPASPLAEEHVSKMYENYVRMCESLRNSNFVPNKCELEDKAVKFEFLNDKTMESPPTRHFYPMNFFAPPMNTPVLLGEFQPNKQEYFCIKSKDFLFS